MSLLCREIQCDDSDTVPPPFLRMPPALRRRAMRTRRAASHRAHARRSTGGDRHGRSDGQRAGDGDQTGTYAAQPPRRGLGRGTRDDRAARRHRHQGTLAARSQFPHPRLRFAHDLVGLRARLGRTHRPAGHGPQRGQRPLPLEGRLRLRPGGHRTHRGAARPAEHALRPQHHGRRDEHLHPLAARLPGDAAGCGVCFGQHAAAARLDLPPPLAPHGCLAGGAVHARRRLFHQRIHGTHLRLGAFGRGTDAASIPPRRAVEHRQHPRVRDAPAGRLPLCLGRDGAHRLQRPLRLPPHDAQRRPDDTLRRRRVGDRLDHQLPVQRRPHRITG